MDDETSKRVVLVDVTGRCANLSLVDRLARIRLDALRRGCTLRLLGSSDDLRRLIALVGLADLLLESDRQIEGREQLGIEEVVDLGDLPA